jgi:hypothetical protein
MKRHPIDPLSFVFGAFFLATGLIFTFGGDASKLHVAWFWPVVLGVTGVGLMLVTIRSVRPERETVAMADGEPAIEAEPAAEPVTLDVERDEPGRFGSSSDDEPGSQPGPDTTEFDR